MCARHPMAAVRWPINVTEEEATSGECRSDCMEAVTPASNARRRAVSSSSSSGGGSAGWSCSCPTCGWYCGRAGQWEWEWWWPAGSWVASRVGVRVPVCCSIIVGEVSCGVRGVSDVDGNFQVCGHSIMVFVGRGHTALRCYVCGNVDLWPRLSRVRSAALSCCLSFSRTRIRFDVSAGE